mmetsp:Transcript_63954/g.116760  ORF Transcript_63954/g.116760 Transcript_63954/m.116760 type:complete len:1024 (-) Transcript_63954:30-3101(-)
MATQAPLAAAQADGGCLVPATAERRAGRRFWTPQDQRHSWCSVASPLMLRARVSLTAGPSDGLVPLLPLIFEKLLGQPLDSVWGVPVISTSCAKESAPDDVKADAAVADASPTSSGPSSCAPEEQKRGVASAAAGSLDVVAALPVFPPACDGLFEVSTPIGVVRLRLDGVHEADARGPDATFETAGPEEDVLLLTLPSDWFDPSLLRLAWDKKVLEVPLEENIDSSARSADGSHSGAAWRDWLAQWGEVRSFELSMHMGDREADTSVLLAVTFTDEVLGDEGGSASSLRRCMEALSGDRLLVLKDPPRAVFPRARLTSRLDFEAKAEVAWQEHVVFEQELARVDLALVLEEAADAVPVGVEASFGPLLHLLQCWGPRGILRATSTICAQRRLQEEDPGSRGNPPEIFRRACWNSALRIVAQISPCKDDVDTFGLALCEHWRKAHGICLDVDGEDIAELTEALQEVWRLSKNAEDAKRQSQEQDAHSAEKALLEALDAEEGRTVRERKKRERRRQKERQKRRARSGTAEAAAEEAPAGASAEADCEDLPSTESSGQQGTESSGDASADAPPASPEPTEAVALTAAEVWWHEAACQLLAEWKAPVNNAEARWHEAARRLLSECKTADVSSAEVRWHEVARQLLSSAYRRAVVAACCANNPEHGGEAAASDAAIAKNSTDLSAHEESQKSDQPALVPQPSTPAAATAASSAAATDAAATDHAELSALTLTPVRAVQSPQPTTTRPTPAPLSFSPASATPEATLTPSQPSSTSSSARRSQRRRRQRMEAKAKAAASETCTALRASTVSSTASTSAASGSASTVSAAWSEEDESASCFSRRTSAGESTVGLLGTSPVKPHAESIGTTPTACRNVVTWSDLLGGGSAFPCSGDKSNAASLRPPPPPPPAAPPRLAATIAAQDAAHLAAPAGFSPTSVPHWLQTWPAAAAEVPGAMASIMPQPGTPCALTSHGDAWAAAPATMLPAMTQVLPGFEGGADALRSWLDASGLPSGAALEAQLQASAPDAYED